MWFFITKQQLYAVCDVNFIKTSSSSSSSRRHKNVVESLLSFYKNVVQCFNKGYVTDESTFEKSVLNQPLWGKKYITYYVGRRKNVLFLRNWIRSGVKVVGDLPFRNGVLDENEMNNMLDNKTNMYFEVRLVKTALYQYRMNIVNGNKESVVQIRPISKSCMEFLHAIRT